ncbi:MAG: non-ribosomal peptide synthetase [Bryobacteraceae bacterium]
MGSRLLDSAVGPNDADQHQSAILSAGKETHGQGALVPQLIAAQAAAEPNRIAIVAGNEELTYSGLERRANQLGHHLRSIEVGPDTRVAICLPRSTAQIVAFLSVLKAGGGYVPLDPAYPEERLAWMLNDAQPAVLITGKCLPNRFAGGNWQTIDLESDEEQIASHSLEELVGGSARPEHLAYIIYTSGSTGRPKGVEITHKSLLNLVSWHQREFRVTPSDRASQLASPGFDAAVWELWPYLTGGASVHLAADGIRSDPKAVRNWMISENISIGFAPTPLAERMIRLDWPRETALRVLLTGADTLRSYPSASLPFKLINNYGPTECTVVATSGQVPSNGRREVLPSIGRPISNVQIYILDEHLNQVPNGAPGEIYIGGAGVARRYLNAPDLTAAKFIANPFDRGSNGRLYRTGDVACYLPDGQISFLGRLDDQLKIRGYRIEPNEIVSALAEHPTVQMSVVVGRDDAAGEKRIVAYIVPKLGTRPTDKDLRDFLSSRLPEYMVPATFVRIDSLPINASGKIDRVALPMPDESNCLYADAYVVPRTPIEDRIAQIVAPLVGVEKVGSEDNFFLLGGHSLLGTQLIARIRDAFGVELRLRVLFESPTTAALASEVERLLYLRLNAMSEEEVENALKSTASGSAGPNPIGLSAI